MNNKPHDKFKVLIPVKHRRAYECAVEQIQILEKAQDEIFKVLLERLNIDSESREADVIFDIAFNHPSLVRTSVKFK